MNFASPQIQMDGVAPSAALSDDALCRAFLAGDRQAFVGLVERYQQQIYVLMRRYSRDGDGARDLTQQVFLRAFESVRRSLLSRAGLVSYPFAAWLFRLALNLGKGHARQTLRRSKAFLLATQAPVAPQSSPHDALEEQERRGAAQRALLSLPRRQREVVSLRADAGLRFAQVAQLLGITENSARVSYHHALKRLQAELAWNE